MPTLAKGSVFLPVLLKRDMLHVRGAPLDYLQAIWDGESGNECGLCGCKDGNGCRVALVVVVVVVSA
jgi:hypothetical protein